LASSLSHRRDVERHANQEEDRGCHAISWPPWFNAFEGDWECKAPFFIVQKTLYFDMC